MAEMTLEGVDARPEDSAFALGRVHSIETMGTAVSYTHLDVYKRQLQTTLRSWARMVPAAL